MRGRKPSLKNLAGAAGKKAERPICPPHLDEEAQAEWQRMTAALAPMKILAKIDRAALALYCSAWARWVHAELKLKETDAVVRGTQGNGVLNPWLSVSRQAMMQMRSFLSEFGLTPVARQRLYAGQQERDSLADTLSG